MYQSIPAESIPLRLLRAFACLISTGGVATGCEITTTMMRVVMVMTIVMVTITLVQFELGTSVCSSLGLIHDPMKQNITHKFSLQIPSRLFLYSMVHSLQSFKMERELHTHILLLEKRSTMYLLTAL